jgi:hypothetical protein
VLEAKADEDLKAVFLEKVLQVGGIIDPLFGIPAGGAAIARDSDGLETGWGFGAAERGRGLKFARQAEHIRRAAFWALQVFHLAILSGLLAR